MFYACICGIKVFWLAIAIAGTTWILAYCTQKSNVNSSTNSKLWQLNYGICVSALFFAVTVCEEGELYFDKFIRCSRSQCSILFENQLDLIHIYIQSYCGSSIFMVRLLIWNRCLTDCILNQCIIAPIQIHFDLDNLELPTGIRLFICFGVANIDSVTIFPNE